MKWILLLATLLAVGEAISFENLVMEEWNLFKSAHSKKYPLEEERYRLKIYMDNKKKVLKHNSKFNKGLVSFSMKLNHFADLLSHEFAEIMNGYNSTLKSHPLYSKVQRSTFLPPANVKVPEAVDWREKGAVTDIKNQGSCGSCWSFSATGALEGQHFRKTGRLISLSEQNLIDCSTKYGNNGCNGGLMDYAFQYVKDNRGIDTEKSYPYEGSDDTCRYDPSASGASDTGMVDVPQGDEDKLKYAVATVGPVSVAIDASHESFQFYNKGVYVEPECDPSALDHGVLVVGYGTSEEGDDFWIVKNSWGETWGDGGYIRMARNRNNQCGIASSASYPLV